MSKLRSFSRGGIHPSVSRNITAGKAIKNAPFPATAIVPLSQHVGSPSRLLVSVGDRVQETQIIGEPTGFMSAAIHSPIPGEVKEIRTIYLPSGVKTQAVVIELGGEFSLFNGDNVTRNWASLARNEILEILKNKGVVGQGGATFPAHVKFTIPKSRKVEAFLVNASECEPYLTADYRVMLEHMDDLIEGLGIARKILDPGRIVVGIEADKMDALKVFTDASRDHDIEVVPLKTKYPQGAEKNLIESLLGIEVPSGKLPIEVGVINANVGTLISICRAVRNDEPVISRVLTVAGGGIKNPGNFFTRIGTPVKDLIDECGGLVNNPIKLICGGPMMGFAFTDLNTPVTKGTNGILALTAEEVKYYAQTACLSCGKCIEACPMGLSPTFLYKNTDSQRLEEAANFGLADCILCGACAYVCPAHIPLVSAFRAARGRQRRLSTRKKR